MQKKIKEASKCETNLFSVSCILNLLKKMYSFISTTFFASLLGIVFVASILSALHWASPGLYKWLTYWANQKEVPTLSSCRFKKIPFEELKQFTWYTVDIELDKKVRASAIIYPTREYLTVQKNEGKITPALTKDEPYLVLWKKNFGYKPISIRLQVDDEYELFEENKLYSYYDCPLKVEFLIDE
ncbi:MAG TPA: hypothetical protein PK657_03570 [Legionella sp.]|nr:hypothetical protein [Legionella sp.]